MSQSLENVIFDIGDVLFSYRWQQMLMNYGLSAEEANRVGREMFADPRNLWHEYDLANYTREDLIRQYQEEWPADIAPIAWFIRHGEYMTVPRPKVWEQVHALKEKGYHLFLLSNYPEELFYKHTEYADFMKDMDGYVISFQYHIGKPEKAIYDKLCTKYGLLPSESLFFDDREENVEGALDYGLQSKRVASQEGLIADMKRLVE